MLLAMLTLLTTLARTKVPFGRQLDLSVSLRHVIQVDFIIMQGLVCIFPIHGLDDVLTLDLKEGMVSSQRTQWLSRHLNFYCRSDWCDRSKRERRRSSSIR